MANSAIICGGRDWSDVGASFAWLDRINATLNLVGVFHGNARGADLIGDAWATQRGVWVHSYPADWRKHGKAAGPMRNAEMAASGANHCLAFPGGRGTADMVRKASAAGLPVYRFPVVTPCLPGCWHLPSHDGPPRS